MATSMAAALAASLPAPTAAVAPAAPTYEDIPASMAKIIDSDAEIPVTSIQLDALVVTKIVKHCREIGSNHAHGLLLGLDFDGTMEISNSFPLPQHASEDDEKASKSSLRYQAAMLRSLKEVHADDSVVGFYQSTTLGAFFSQSLIETQALHQNRLRHGGVIVIHDLTSTARGSAAFKAFRLSKTFLAAYKKQNFTATNLANQKLTFSSIMEEIPLKVRANPLAASFLDSITTPPTTATLAHTVPTSDVVTGFEPSFSHLDLGTNDVQSNFERIIDAIDNLRTEEGNLAYLHRQIGREKARADAYVAKRKDENAARVAQGLNPLPEDDVNRLFKIPPEPSRLDSLLMMGQIDAYAKALGASASTELIRMYAARG